jgi:acyl carrier protein
MSPGTLALDHRPVMAALADVFRTVFDDPEISITEATCADDVPGWDSMTHIALIVEAECRFGVTFAAAELDSLRQVGDLARLIEAKRGAG